MAGELEFSEEMRVQRELQRTGKYGRAVYRALLLLILWIEMTFIMGCLITLLEISFPMRPLFYAGAVCGLVWTVFFSASKKWRYLLLFVYLCVVGIFVYQNMEMIRDGFFYLANSFNKHVMVPFLPCFCSRLEPAWRSRSFAVGEGFCPSCCLRGHRFSGLWSVWCRCLFFLSAVFFWRSCSFHLAGWERSIMFQTTK